MNLKKCLFCERTFQPVRESAKYCTNSCRVKACNIRKGRPAHLFDKQEKEGLKVNNQDIINNLQTQITQQNQRISEQDKKIDFLKTEYKILMDDFYQLKNSLEN